MIEGNILRFGYGDIAGDGGISEYGVLKFQQIKPPQEIGTSVAWETERVSEPVVFRDLFSMLKITAFAMEVKEGKYKSFEVDGWIFDFETNFNIKSVEAVIRQSRRACEQALMLTAC